jgi:hypothetical protein
MRVRGLDRSTQPGADMTKRPTAGSTVERARANSLLIEQLRDILKDTPLDVVGHLDDAAGGLCCGKTGTVALVYIEKGRPPDRPARATRARSPSAKRRAR